MQGFTEVRNKIMFIENLLGETEKLMWTQWRMAYTAEYEALVASGDGDEGTQNIISQMRTVFTLEFTTGISTYLLSRMRIMRCLFPLTNSSPAFHATVRFKDYEIEAEEAEASASMKQAPEEQHIHTFTLAQGEVKERKKNMLYNITVEIDIPGSKRTSLNAILDTGATTCVVDSDSVPADVLEENSLAICS